MFQVKKINDVYQLLESRLNQIHLQTEVIPIEQALNRVIASDVISNTYVPDFRRSTVDGYALISMDTHGASSSNKLFFKNIGEQLIGEENTQILEHDQTQYVPTGGMIPKHADCVIKIEETNQINSNTIIISKPMKSMQNIIDLGDDVKKGDIVLKKYHTLRAQDIGVCSSIGVTHVKVFHKITVSIYSTGNEIQSPNEPSQIGKVKDINTFTIAAKAQGVGCHVLESMVLKDEESLIKSKIEDAIATSNIVILSGGSSVGTKDLTLKVLEDIEGCEILCHGLSIKPGKPTIFAMVNDTLIFGLPGQPASAYIVFHLFISHILAYFYHQKPTDKPYLIRKLNNNVHASEGRMLIQMVKIVDETYVEPIKGKSGLITMLSNGYGYIVVDEYSEGLYQEDDVKVYKL